MSICIIKTISQLDDKFILTPEHYNPKRTLSIIHKGVRLSELVYLSDELFSLKMNESMNLYTINTGDAMSGYLRIPTKKDNVNSNKKILHQGDVIISRLRPYLKQIAYVDEISDNFVLYASTEFYVLRSRDNKSIAFLVPYLLSDATQEVFANSVEGSQHPRFRVDVLNNLIVPINILQNRDQLSHEVINAIHDYRQYENRLRKQIDIVNSEFKRN